MVRILVDPEGRAVIQTTATDSAAFIEDLGEAIANVFFGKGENDTIDQQTMTIFVMEALRNAMPIAYKLSGYKADNVFEQRTLVCGHVSPAMCKEVSSAGR